MSLETDYGRVCPLGRFSVDIAGGCGSYTSDPLEACLSCNFYQEHESFDIATGCRCPPDMRESDYERIKIEYCSKTPKEKRTKSDFWGFVKNNWHK